MVGRFNRWLEYVVRIFRFFRTFKIFTLSPKARSILDIGSGRGFMLYFLKKYYGYQRAAGTQIAKKAFEFSRDKLGLEMYNKDLLEIPFEEKTFDIVSLWHVLEHIRNPECYIERIRKILREKGKLIIEVPNFNSWTRYITGQYWLGLDLDYHIYFFTPVTLSNLLKKYGFKIRGIHTFSLEYSAFLSTQSLVSRLTRSDQLFYRRLQTGKIGWKLFPHILLFSVLMPICFIINVLLYFSQRGEVLLVIAEKPSGE